MNKKKSTLHKADVPEQLRAVQQEGLSFEEMLSIEEDFLHQGLEYWLKKFRVEQAITQHQIAEALGISQSAVCQMLKKPSRLATLARLISAMGGSLDITVTHNGKTTSLLYGTTNEQMTQNGHSNESNA